MKLKNKSVHRFLILMAYAVLLIEANYWALIDALGVNNEYVRLLLIGIMAAIVIVMRLRLKLLRLHFIWFTYLGIVLMNNAKLKLGLRAYTMNIVVCILFFFVCTYQCEWTKLAPAFIIGIGLPNMLATVLFYINNDLYVSFIAVTYKEYQLGTEVGEHGYKAALSDHYSQNGTYICIAMLILFVVLFCASLKKGQKLMVIACAVGSIFAIFLTTKRAHLLFGGVAIFAIYYIANRESLSKKMTRTLIIIGGIVASGGMIIEMVPAVSQTLDRLSRAGSDGASQYRLIMWDYAMSHTMEKPFFGHGWYAFCENREIAWVDGASAGAHNVYVQLFYDVGIIGFLIVVTALLSTFVMTVKLLIAIKRSNTEYLLAIATSLVLQIFFIMYGFTGNFLFDPTFYFYATGVAISLSIKANLSKVLTKPKIQLKGGTPGEPLRELSHV